MNLRLWRLAALGGAFCGLASSSSAELIGAGKAMPAWSGTTIAGKPINSSAYKGKAILLNFFSYG